MEISSYIKKLLPKTIFVRFFLIIIIPTIIAQLFSSYMFYERHWSNVNTHMVKNLVGEIRAITKIYDHHNLKNDQDLLEIIHNSFGLKLDFTNQQFLNKTSHLELEYLDQSISKSIALPINVYYIDNETTIVVEIALSDGMLTIKFPKKRLDNPTTYIFILWMTGAASLFSLLSVIFLKNQLTSIHKLADAAQAFGKGRSIDNFKPSGASEVRKAGAAFLKMKERIERQITQRTEMLAGVSHDLRTPLTRIKLQLAMLEENEETLGMVEDVQEMEKMIQHYLDFAKGEEGEKSVLADLTALLITCVSHYKSRLSELEINIEDNMASSVKINAMKRAIANIIENTVKYADKASIDSFISPKYWVIEINDNGPGIEKSEIKKVFNAFYRVDNSRNSSTGGVGLGLSISKDIISSHGGRIYLSQSTKLGGLRVLIRIPL